MLDSVKLDRFVHFKDKGINVFICLTACTAFLVLVPTSCLIKHLKDITQVCFTCTGSLTMVSLSSSVIIFLLKDPSAK